MLSAARGMWLHSEMDVLYSLILDQERWPPLGNMRGVARAEEEQRRRDALQKLLPRRSWMAITSKLFRMNVRGDVLTSIIGSGYRENSDKSTIKCRTMRLRGATRKWIAWTTQVHLLSRDGALHQEQTPT